MKIVRNRLFKGLLVAGSLLLLGGTVGVAKNANASGVPNRVNNQINRQINHMSYRQRLAQLFVVEVGNNTSANDRYIREYHPGGLLLDTDNFSSSRTANKSRIKSMQRASGNNLLISTDVEGGEINRLGGFYPYPRYASPSVEYSRGGLRGIRNEYRAIGRNMHNLGLNWDYAPDGDPDSGYMRFRTVKRGPQTTARYVRAAVSGLQERKVAATVKHYPGYRGSLDTDYYPTYSNIGSGTYNSDLTPFKGAIAGKVDSIMTNSVVYDHFSREPANLSRNIVMPLHNFYHGVIVTDTLGSGAIRGHGFADYKALKAGNTMVMNDDLPGKLRYLVNDMHKGYLSKRLLNNDVKRVLELKYKLGLHY